MKKSLIWRSLVIILAVCISAYFIITKSINKGIEVAVTTVAQAGQNQTEKPECQIHNVILIVIDTLRADHLSCYGHELNTSPNICKFAEEGLIFNNMFSQSPSTKPSIASLFTSMYPSQHKTINNEDILNNKVITLAEILKENNYNTYAVNSNSVIKAKFNYHQGFMRWTDAKGFDASELNKLIFNEQENYKEPFFLYIHYIDPHCPYTAPDPYYKFFNNNYTGNVNGKFNNRDKNYFKDNPDELEQLKLFYDNEIRFVDNEISNLFKTLKENKLYDNSAIILLSDHGEMFLEHGSLEHSNGLYSEVIHVPLIMKIPNSKKNITIDTHVQTIDILPTILDLLNIDSKYEFMGESIFSLTNNDRPIFCEHLRLTWSNPQRSLILNDHKLIKNLLSDEYYLFDLKKDKGEKNNILNKFRLSNDMTNKMESLIKYCNISKIEKQTTDLDKETIDQLKSLGYIN